MRRANQPISESDRVLYRITKEDEQAILVMYNTLNERLSKLTGPANQVERAKLRREYQYNKHNYLHQHCRVSAKRII